MLLLVWVTVASPLQQLEEAARRALAGDPAGARRLYEEVAESDDKLADTALLRLGQLWEGRLGDSAAALSAYERLLRRFPQSRHRRRAGLRVDALRGVGSAKPPAALLRLQSIRRMPRGIARSTARRGWLKAHPDHRRADAERWADVLDLGALGLEPEAVEQANILADRAASGLGWRFTAREWLVRKHLKMGHLEKARQGIEGLVGLHGAMAGCTHVRCRGAASALAFVRERLQRLRWRKRWDGVASAILVVLLFGALWWGRGQPWGPIPWEVGYLGPVLLALCGVAFLQPQTSHWAGALTGAGVGVLAWIWLVGRAAPRVGGTPLRFVLPLLSVAFVAALGYGVLRARGDLPAVMHTLRWGPQR